jgi:acetyl/propionyl-CoA carboxylase alpha subunit
LREFKRVLIANRGEIALRVIRALRELEIESVAVYSTPDTSALHVTEATKAFHLEGEFAKDTYLSQQKIIEIARISESDAIHPGYGFLSENASFSRLCRDNSITFIGPSPETLEISGNKVECKKLAESRGVPVLPYTTDPVEDANEAAKRASEIGFPVLLKSAFGGGGRGIKEAKSKSEVKEGFESSEREAKSAFGRYAVYIEKRLVRPRHIEIQILASSESDEAIHLGERDCSIQRRYQKLVEVSPSPVVDQETRNRVAGYALKIARDCRYSNAGTVEFLRDSETGQFYFLEVNSRLQVEHPITELLTGIDLVRSQIEVASRKKLPLKQSDVSFRGSAIECRINSEDPWHAFAPVSGRVTYLSFPSGPGVRVDSALYEGMEISPFYDSLVAKIISWGRDFDESRIREIYALKEFKVAGIETTAPFHVGVLSDPKFAAGDFTTGFIEETPNLLAHNRVDGDANHKFAIAALLISNEQFGKFRAAKNAVGSSRRVWASTRGQGRFVDAL